jgi:uncharacterized protein YneF (UPF0154 family)
MFTFIDGLGVWVEFSAVLVLGVWIGRRWAKTVMQAKCDARNCDTLKTMRTEKMKLSADKLSAERVNEFMRNTLRQKDEKIHSLKTSNGIMGKEIQKLTYQLPRQTRRMVA